MHQFTQKLPCRIWLLVSSHRKVDAKRMGSSLDLSPMCCFSECNECLCMARVSPHLHIKACIVTGGMGGEHRHSTFFCLVSPLLLTRREKERCWQGQCTANTQVESTWHPAPVFAQCQPPSHLSPPLLPPSSHQRCDQPEVR